MIQGGVPITTLERAVSTDVTIAEELLARYTTEIARVAARYFQTGEPPQGPVRSHLASGLTVNQSGGTTVVVNTGVLMQQVSANPPSVPAPDTFDSSYRVGLNLSTLDAGDPYDATTAYWLLEARVVRVTTLSEKRDIWNPLLLPPAFQLSAANLDKRYESEVEVQWTKGTATDLPANTAGWAPLAGLYRPIPGGVISDQDVFNLSVQVNDVAQLSTTENAVVRNDFLLRTNLGIGLGSSGFEHRLDGETDGIRLFSHSVPGTVVDFRSTLIMEAASAVALQTSDTWGYVYLAPLQDRMPSDLYTNVRHRGAMVVSRTPPDIYGRNSAPILAPSPLNENIPAFGAVHVGIVQSGGVAAWNYMNCASNGDARCEIKEFNNGNFPLNSANNFVGPIASPINFGTTGPGGTEDAPFGVQWKCFCNHTDLNSGAVAEAVEVIFRMTNDAGGVYPAYPRLLLSCRTLGNWFFELFPKSPAGVLSVTVQATARDTGMGSIATANAAGNEYVAGIWGFRF